MYVMYIRALGKKATGCAKKYSGSKTMRRRPQGTCDEWSPGQIQTMPLLTLNEGHGEEEDDEQEGYAPRPMDGTLGVSGARAEQYGQDAMALPPNVIHLRLLVGVGDVCCVGVCCIVVCCVVRHCYCYCSCFCFCWQGSDPSVVGRSQSAMSACIMHAVVSGQASSKQGRQFYRFGPVA